MKKAKKDNLTIKKVTLQDLDQPALNKVAGASNLGGTCLTCTVCPKHTCISCKVQC